jgi:hypothetical protein
MATLTVAACAGRQDDGGEPTLTPDSGLAVSEGPCNTLTNDAPVIHTACSCTGCLQTGTAAIPNGTYVMKMLVNYTQDCPMLAAENIRGKMVVNGNVMDVVIEQPGVVVGDTEVARMRYTYTLASGIMTLDWTCPPSDGGLTSEVINYYSDGKTFRFQSLPGTHGDTIFAAQ